MSDVEMPIAYDLMWPTIRALRELGGSARIAEIVDHVIEAEGFTEEQLAATVGKAGHPKVVYNLGWARTNLKNIGLLENSSRGVWALTAGGWRIERVQMDADWVEWQDADRRRRAEKRRTEHDDEGDDFDDDSEANWKEMLLGRLGSLSPSGFERLAQRLLREAGFQNVEVLGRSGDGGIDGVGIYRVSLVSFQTFFQCKRWQHNVDAKQVRDFRGAMVGRGEKGLLITTSSFTRGAEAEATRDGASIVDLVSGDELCDLLKDHGLGVEARQVEPDYTVDSKFFDQFDDD